MNTNSFPIDLVQSKKLVSVMAATKLTPLPLQLPTHCASEPAAVSAPGESERARENEREREHEHERAQYCYRRNRVPLPVHFLSCVQHLRCYLWPRFMLKCSSYTHTKCRSARLVVRPRTLGQWVIRLNCRHSH